MAHDRVPRRSAAFLVAGGFVALATLGVAAQQAGDRPGYSDTPLLPGSRWRVHDKDRPEPPIVTPGTASTPEQAGRAPSDAIVLFDGRDLSQWTGASGEARWKVEGGFFEVNGTGDVWTRESFGDCQLHLEFATPDPPAGDSQGRGNSGVFLMERYEVQLLDCFGNATYPDGQTAALYGQWPPLVNACRKPGEWQSYDVVFEAPRFDGEKLLSPARVTVLHNGVLVHHAREFIGPTAHRSVPSYSPHPPQAPIKLQDHGNPVRFRNVWVRRLERADD